MKKIIASLFIMSAFFCFLAADNCRADININLPENIEGLNELKELFTNEEIGNQVSEKVKSELDENSIPAWKQVIVWLKEFAWPKIEKVIDKIMTPEREEELEREAEEAKSDFPHFLEQLKSFIDEIKTAFESE